MEKGKHPPMRCWLAAPIIDGVTGKNWGLLQLSDKDEGEFTEADEAHFVAFVALVSQALGVLREARNPKKAQE